MTTTIEKIESFATFPPNWSFGEGKTFEPQILNKALQLVKTACALGFQETDAFPGLNGEVMVTVYRDIDYWEFTLEPHGALTFVYERENKNISYQEGLPFVLS